MSQDFDVMMPIGTRLHSSEVWAALQLLNIGEILVLVSVFWRR